MDFSDMSISQLLDLKFRIKDEISKKYGFWDGVEALYNLNKELEQYKNIIERKEESIKKYHTQILKMKKLGFSYVLLDINKIAFINFSKTIEKNDTKEFYSINLTKNSSELELNPLNKICDAEFEQIKSILKVQTIQIYKGIEK